MANKKIEISVGLKNKIESILKQNMLLSLKYEELISKYKQKNKDSA